MENEGLENETEALEVLKNHMALYGLNHIETDPGSVIDAMEEYALLKTSALKEQLEKLQEDCRVILELSAEKRIEAETALKSSQEEASLLKSQLERAIEATSIYIEQIDFQKNQLEEKEGEIERLKGGRGNERAAGWISVDKELPEQGEFVIMYWPSGRLATMARFDGNVFMYLGSRYIPGQHITNWLPMPPFPQPPGLQETHSKADNSNPETEGADLTQV